MAVGPHQPSKQLAEQLVPLGKGLRSAPSVLNNPGQPLSALEAEFSAAFRKGHTQPEFQDGRGMRLLTLNAANAAHTPKYRRLLNSHISLHCADPVEVLNKKYRAFFNDSTLDHQMHVPAR